MTNLFLMVRSRRSRRLEPWLRGHPSRRPPFGGLLRMRMGDCACTTAPGDATHLASDANLHISALRTPPKAGFVMSVAEKMERSEEHTSELQSRPHLVCRLLLEKKK